MLIGDKVGLRLVEEEDLPLLARWRNAPQTRLLFFTPFMVSLAAQKKWYEALLNDPTRMQFMILRLEDNVPIGTIGLSHIDYRNQEAEISNPIIDPAESHSQWGNDAVVTLIRYAFKDLNLHRVYSHHYAFDTSSMEQAAELGFQQEVVARKAAFVKGQFHDVIMMALLKEEWPYLNQGEQRFT